MVLRRIARPLLSVAFIGQGVNSLLNPKSAAEAAAPAVDGLQSLPDPLGSSIPSDPQTVAQITAAVQIGGGLLLATGKLPRIASAALALTVLPANLGTHSFWNEPDPELKAEKRQQFLTDLSLVGGLLIASADTAGKPSLGWRGRRAAERLSERVSSALPGLRRRRLRGTRRKDRARLAGRRRTRPRTRQHRGRTKRTLRRSRAGTRPRTGQHRRRTERALRRRARKRGRELASTAADKSAPLAKKARKRGEKLAKKARKRGEELAETARERGSDFADTAAARGAEWPTCRAASESADKPSAHRFDTARLGEQPPAVAPG